MVLCPQCNEAEDQHIIRHFGRCVSCMDEIINMQESEVGRLKGKVARQSNLFETAWDILGAYVRNKQVLENEQVNLGEW